MPRTGVLTITGGEDSAFVAPRLVLTETQHVVGRAAQHKTGFLNIKQPYVSGRHFCIDIEYENGEATSFTLADLSTNGTFVNGHVVGKGNRTQLADGDTVAIRFKEALKIVYTFNIVTDISKAPAISSDPVDVSAVAGGKDVPPAAARAHSDAEFDLLSKRFGLLQAEMEEQDARLSSAVAKKEAALRDLAAAMRERDAAGQQAAGLSERVAELESHSASVEARGRVLEEQLAALKTQLEAQKAKAGAVADAEVQLQELRARVAGLKEELAVKSAHADSRQRLLDEANEALSREASARVAAEASSSKLRVALQSINTDLYSSEIEKSTSSVQLADAAQKLGSALASEKQLKALLLRSQRVILTQRDMMSTSFRSMSAMHRQLGQVLASYLAHQPLPEDAPAVGDAAADRGDAHKAAVDSQIEELRVAGVADVNAFQSLLVIVESEVFPGNGENYMGADTFADSLLTSRMPSIRSVDAEDQASQLSGVINSVTRDGDSTQAQNCDFGASLPHFATQQGDSDPEMEVDNNATEVPREYQSPSDFMSPVTTPPNSAQSPVPSGVKIRYRSGNNAETGNGVGVRLDLDDGACGLSFKRPLDVVLEAAEHGEDSGSQRSVGSRGAGSNPHKMARTDSVPAASNEEKIGDGSENSKVRSVHISDSEKNGILSSESGKRKGSSEEIENIENEDSCTPGLRLG